MANSGTGQKRQFPYNRYPPCRGPPTRLSRGSVEGARKPPDPRIAEARPSAQFRPGTSSAYRCRNPPRPPESSRNWNDTRVPGDPVPACGGALPIAASAPSIPNPIEPRPEPVETTQHPSSRARLDPHCTRSPRTRIAPPPSHPPPGVPPPDPPHHHEVHHRYTNSPAGDPWPGVWPQTRHSFQDGPSPNSPPHSHTPHRAARKTLHPNARSGPFPPAGSTVPNRTTDYPPTPSSPSPPPPTRAPSTHPPTPRPLPSKTLCVTTCSSPNSNPNLPPFQVSKPEPEQLKPNQLPTEESSKLTKALTIELPLFSKQRHSMAPSGSGFGSKQAWEAIKPPPARSAKAPSSPELPCKRRTDPAEPQPRSTPKHSHQVPAPHHPRITKSDPFCVNMRD